MPTNDEVTLGQGRVRLPYVKPFVRNLDASDTETKPNFNLSEYFSGSTTNGGYKVSAGPS
jgi:hypothetical protein